MTDALLNRMQSYALISPVADAKGTWLHQRGETRFAPGRWRRLRAEQQIDAVRLGFRWQARVHAAFGLSMTVTDGFEHDHGMLEARLLGIRLARAVGPEVDEGEFSRFLAELPWCPVAYRHRALTWKARDEHTLTVSRDRAGNTANVTMQVDEVGRVSRSWCPDRPRRVGKQFVRTAMSGEFSDYREIGGMRIPARAVVSWALPDGLFTWFRGEISDAGLIG